MKLLEYRQLIEEKIKVITLPNSNDEIEEILEVLWESMESVSISDLRLFQAMMIVEDWREHFENIGRSTKELQDRN